MPNRSRLTDLALLLACVTLVLATVPGCGDDELPLLAGEADSYAYAVSTLLIRADDPEQQQQPGSKSRSESNARALAFRIYDRIQNGESFFELARQFSEADNNAQDGFIGFVKMTEENRFVGAIQALSPGQTSRPVRTQYGFEIIHRHSLAEGEQREQKYEIPVYGFFLPFEGQMARMDRESAKTLAGQLHAALVAGTTTLEEARRTYTALPPNARPDAFLMMAADRGAQGPIYERVRKVQPGEYIRPFETPEGFAILQRGHHIRAVVRHIVIMHVGVEGRPLDVKRSMADARAQAERCLSELKPDMSNWDQLVQRYTDDDTRARPSGTLGLIGPGDMPPELEEAVRNTEPGKVHSKVVESVIGFHVVWRMR